MEDGETQQVVSTRLDQCNDGASWRQSIVGTSGRRRCCCIDCRDINTGDRAVSHDGGEHCRRASSPEWKQLLRWEEADETAHMRDTRRGTDPEKPNLTGGHALDRRISH